MQLYLPRVLLSEFPSQYRHKQLAVPAVVKFDHAAHENVALLLPETARTHCE